MFEKLNRIAIKLYSGCNMNCSYCFQKYSDKYSPKEFQDYESLYTFLKSCEIEENVIVTFCGGEMTLRPDLIIKCQNKVFKKLERQFDVKFEYAIISNGTNIDIMFDLFDKRVLNHKCCNVSWDGLYSSSLSRHTSEQFSDDYFKNVITKIGSSDYNDLTIVHSLNPSTIDYLFDSFKFMIDNGCKSFGYYPIHEANYTTDFCKKFENELIKIYQYIIDTRYESNFYNLLMMNYKQDENYFTCTKLGHNYYINPQGNIYPCIYLGDHNAYCLGNIKTGVNKELQDKFINDYLIYPDCDYENCKCKVCGECNAACYVNNGNLNKKFKNLCEIRTIEQGVYDRFKELLIPIFKRSLKEEDVIKNAQKLLFKKCDLEIVSNISKQPHIEELRNWK